NMWAQSWVSLLDITQPFSGKPSVDVTPIMEAKNLTALEMFKISEEFFTSLGLKPMPEEFWKHSLIEKPKDREIICHASAWDFCNGKDYRVATPALFSAMPSICLSITCELEELEI
ncbi:angiotensin-converting enzyme, partial [Nephila pilipes]